MDDFQKIRSAFERYDKRKAARLRRPAAASYAAKRRRVRERLDTIARKVRELDEILRAEFGPEAFVFFEADGTICAMSGDDTNGSSTERQRYVVAQADHYARYGAGAW